MCWYRFIFVVIFMNINVINCCKWMRSLSNHCDLKFLYIKGKKMYIFVPSHFWKSQWKLYKLLQRRPRAEAEVQELTPCSQSGNVSKTKRTQMPAALSSQCFWKIPYKFLLWRKSLHRPRLSKAGHTERTVYWDDWAQYGTYHILVTDVKVV